MVTALATSIESNLYHYRARVERVVDGDTLIVEIDLGMGVFMKDVKIRLAGINTPELVGATSVAGKAATEATRSLVEGKPILLETQKDRKEKYGRYVGVVWVRQEGTSAANGVLTNVNEWLVANGHAQRATY